MAPRRLSLDQHCRTYQRKGIAGPGDAKFCSAHKDRGQLKQLAFVFFAYDIFASGLTPVGSRVESRAFCTLIIYVFQYYI